MEMPNLVRHGLCRDYETGYFSDATNMMYKIIQTKKSPEEISEMIRETWEYIKNENKSNHVTSHFFYLLSSEVERNWIKDISLEIMTYGLNHDDLEVVDEAIQLTERWNDKEILDLLYNTEIKEKWLHDYKMKILEQFSYFDLKEK